MLFGALSLLGKIAEFVAKSLQAKHMARATDKRGYACRPVTRLYFLMVELRSLALYMLRNAEIAVAHKDPSLLAFSFRDARRRIVNSTNDFVETFNMIAHALEIFCPDVGDAIAVIANTKLTILWKLSEYAILEQDAEHLAVRKVRYLRADDRMLELEIDAFMQRLAKREFEVPGFKFEWPETLLYCGQPEGAFHPAEISFVDMGEVQEFVDMLRTHGVALDQGIAALRQYIRDTFTIDEVLYENVEIAPPWFG